MGIESLLPAKSIESVERSLSWDIKSTASLALRKRSEEDSNSSYKSKRVIVTDCLARQVGSIAVQLKAIVAVIDTNYQRDALGILIKDFMVLHLQLLLTLAEVLESELKAKSFKLLPSPIRRHWAYS